MTRQRLLAGLAGASVFDLAVIGGGATGLGVALDAALRGFSVALLESHDFAGGTSSRATKLLHGGVRYLAQGNLSLVGEALAERATVMRLAPHLAQPLPFVLPSFHWWQTPFYGAGLKAYDLLAGRAGLGHTELLGRQATRDALPGVQTRGLVGGVRYWDGQFDDARLALALARTVERAGGLPVNYAEVRGLQSLTNAADGARFLLDVRDRRAGAAFGVRARTVVNATGVWVDAIRAQAASARGQAAPPRLVSPSQGVHLVVDRAFMPGAHALLVPKTRDGRVLFAVPWLGSLILGTTDTPRRDLPREPDAFEAELDFILDEAGRVLSRPVRRADVRSVWVGLRPLVAATGNSNTKSLSREHTILADDDGLVTVTGGKWTTYRAMAEDVLDACFRAGLLPPRPAGVSAHHALVGAPAPGDTAAVPLWHPPGEHLYGTEIAAVRACPGADRVIGLGLTEAMVRFAARHEYACTVEDILARRSRALFLDAAQALGMSAAVAAILGDETGGDVDQPGFERLAAGYGARGLSAPAA